MTVLCPACRRPIRVPPEKAELPNLKARCAGCQTVFVVGEAPLALASAPAAPAPPPAVARSAEPPTAAPTVRTSAGAIAGARPASRSPGPGAWRRCANHAQTRSEGACSQCRRGWCSECVKRQGTALICPACDGLCATSAQQEQKEARDRLRARPLREEIGAILGYPLVDSVAYVLLAVVVWVFSVAASLAAFGGGVGFLFSQGLLMAYSFTAVNRVASGDLKSFMPNIGDITDLLIPVRLGLAATIVSSGPLLLVLFLGPAVSFFGLSASETTVESSQPAPAPPAPEPRAEPAADQVDEDAAEQAAPANGGLDAEGGKRGTIPPPDAAENERPGWVIPALLLALLWKLVYSPIALTVAAISRSFLQTLNPIVGISSIRSMGAVYWEAMLAYTILALAEWGLSGALGLIPIAGGLLRAFVQSYAYLTIGCLLGLAVFKKAPELGLD